MPPAFELLAIILIIAAGFSRMAAILLAVQLGGYLLICILAGIIEAVRERNLGVALGFPLALWTVHLAWGGAFLWGLLSGIMRGEYLARGE